MSKGATEAKDVKKDSVHKEEGHSPKGGAGAAEHKKPDAPGKSKGHTPVAGGCFSVGCKKEALRFNFCDEHYDHFKFGLIKKSGEPASDYEKKLGHYLAQKAKRGSQKVA